MMHSGQKQCSVGKRCTVAIFMTEFSLWQFDVLMTERIIRIFIKIEDYFFHYFGIITKVDNLLMVTNNNLGKFYCLKCLF